MGKFRPITKREMTPIIQDMTDRLSEMPDGKWTSTVQLMLECGYDPDQYRDDLLQIHYTLFQAADSKPHNPL